jgi:hypothetical protein
VCNASGRLDVLTISARLQIGHPTYGTHASDIAVV